MRKLGAFLLVEPERAREGSGVGRAVIRLAKMGEETVAKFHWEFFRGGGARRPQRVGRPGDRSLHPGAGRFLRLAKGNPRV